MCHEEVIQKNGKSVKFKMCLEGGLCCGMNIIVTIIIIIL